MKSKDTKLYIAKMVETFNYFNNRYWSNKLPIPQFGMCKERLHAWGITYNRPRKLAMRFSINPNSHFFREVMLHEMVHIFQFWKECNHAHNGCYLEYEKRFAKDGYKL